MLQPEPEVCGRGQRKRARREPDEEKREQAKKLRIALVLMVLKYLATVSDSKLRDEVVARVEISKPDFQSTPLRFRRDVSGCVLRREQSIRLKIGRIDFHEKYDNDASPEAFHRVEWKTVTRGHSQPFMVPDKIVYEDECDLKSPALHAEFDAREKLRQTGFEVKVVKLAVPMGAEPLVPSTHTTTFGKTQEALVTKLRKDILAEADERFRALQTRTLPLT